MIPIDKIAELRNYRMLSGGISDKVRCAPGWRWNPSVPVPDYDLWYIAEGAGEIRLAESVYTLEPGTCLLVRPQSLPFAIQDEKRPLIVVFIHFSVQQDSGAPFIPPPEYTYVKDRFAFENMLHNLLEVDRGTRRWKAEEFDYMIKLILIYLYREDYERQSNMSSLTPQQTNKMRNIVDYIHRESPSIGYADIYELAGLSPRYLNYLFRQFAGVSLKKYLNGAKMQKAQHLLTESSMSVTEISELMGYADIYSFSKTFKQHFGISPTTYSKNSLRITPNG